MTHVMRRWYSGVLIATALCVSGPLGAGEYSGIKTSSRLYTTPDPKAGGGIRAELTKPDRPIERVVAVSPDEPRKKCFLGRVRKNRIEFTGLPPGKYDLVVFYADRLYEGLSLQRRSEQNSLTSSDRDKIDQTFRRAVPFFDEKEVHRLEGATGRAGKARALATYLRTGKTGTTMVSGFSGDTFSGQLRSVRLVLLEDVGPGWQIAETRELFRKEVLGDDPKGMLRVDFRKKLNTIRVSDSIKDLGRIDLTQ